MAVKNAYGVDGISLKLLKEVAPILVWLLATIFKFLLATGNIPDEWKVARVTDIFKDGSPLDRSNYRPISVLPICMEVF